MNMNPAQSAAHAAATQTGSARETAGGDTPTDSLQLFVGMLAQAMAPPATGMASEPDEPGTAREDESTAEWALPFVALPLVPVATTAPTLGSSSALAALDAASVTIDADGPPPGAAGSTAATSEVEFTVETGELRVTASGVEGQGQVTTRFDAGAQTVVRTVHVPVGDQRWPEQLGHEVRLLVDRGLQSATLRLSPDHLGPVEVHIDIVNEKANVVFGANQAETRVALHEAIPKLREMFAGAGLALGDAGVRQDARGAYAERDARAPAGSGFGHGEDPDTSSVHAIVGRPGMVDAYA
jgi:flagellar hook-length control protein FliK